jgi:hypothetical protein
MHQHTTRTGAMAQQHAHGHGGANDRRYSLTAWPPTLVAYREELRRAVCAIEERRRRSMRTA